MAAFTGTTSTSVTVSDMSIYKQVCIAIVDTDETTVMGSIIFPCSSWMSGGFTIKAYGASSSVWGSAKANSNTSVTMNRTSTTTSSVFLFGIK